MPSHLDLWKPTLASIVAVVFGVGGSLLGMLLSVGMYVSPAQGQTPTLASALASVGLFAWSPVIAGLALGGLLAVRPYPRGALLLLASAASVAAALFIGAGIGTSVGQGVGVGVLCCGLPTIATAVAGAFSLYKGVASAAQDLRELRAAALAEALRGKRIVDFDALIGASGVAEAELPELLRQVLRVWSIRAVIVREARCVLDADEDAAGQKKVLGAVRAQGRVQAPQIARELDVGDAVVIHWVHALAASGEFHGALHGDTIYSEAALKAKSGGCPGCGSALQAGAGLRRCTYCETEIFS